MTIERITTYGNRSLIVKIDNDGEMQRAVGTLRLFTGETINVVERSYHFTTSNAAIERDMIHLTSFGIIHPEA